jgi:hypothetical protein
MGDGDKRPLTPTLSRKRERGPDRVGREIANLSPSPACGRGARGEGLFYALFNGIEQLERRSADAQPIPY